MADRTSADIFGEIFSYLAEKSNDTISKEKLIQYLWELSKRYDFHPCQMELPEVLEKLGLAHKKYLEGLEGEFEWHYKGDED